MIAFEYETPDNAFRYPSSALCLLTLENGVSVLWDGDWCRRHPRTSWEGEWEFIGSEARMFWRGEQDKEKKNLYHPVIFIERPGECSGEDSVSRSRSATGACLSWIISSNRLRMGDNLSPASSDNLKMLRAIFGCIESLTVGREIYSFVARSRYGTPDRSYFSCTSLDIENRGANCAPIAAAKAEDTSLYRGRR